MTVSTGAGALTAALGVAATYTATHPTDQVELLLGSQSYKLSGPLLLPDRTSLIGQVRLFADFSLTSDGCFLAWLILGEQVGQGAEATILEFDLAPPPPPPAPPPTCSEPVLADFYSKTPAQPAVVILKKRVQCDILLAFPAKECAAKGCHAKLCPGCFQEIGVSHSAGNPAGCCDACGKNQKCNAWTFIGSVDLPVSLLCP